MAVTLSTVFHHFGRNLSVASLFGLSEATLSKSINAVNFTNLINPSPFIANKTLILTTGHLLERNLNRYTALSYLRNLTVRDVPAVIIGPEEINFSKKADMSFLEKCRRLAEFLSQSEVSVGTRIPIFVSQDISFIEMTKYIDSLIVQDTNQQINRIAAAKQVLSKTAFESNSASPVFSKLESQLHTWALCFDSQGMLLSHSESFEHQYGQHYGIVQKQVRKLLYGNRKSACEIEKSGFYAHLESFGQSGDLSGVLVHGRTGEDSQYARQLIAHVLFLMDSFFQGMSKLHLEVEHLNSTLLTMLFAGVDVGKVREIGPIFDSMPHEPFLLIALCEQPNSATSGSTMDRYRIRKRAALATHGAAMFLAEFNGSTILLLENGDYPFEQVFEQSVYAGISRPALYTNIKQAYDEATQALQEAITAEHRRIVQFMPLRTFSDVSELMIRSYRDHHTEVSPLTPLFEYDSRNGTQLALTLQCWLNAGCSWDKTGRALDVHRHTAQIRVERAASILGVDINDARTRVALWVGLESEGKELPDVADDEAPHAL